jgi:hypothetical protein
MHTAEKTGEQIDAGGKMSGGQSGSFTPCAGRDSLLEAPPIENVFSGRKFGHCHPVAGSVAGHQKGGVFERLEAGLKAVGLAFAGMFQLERRRI